MTAARRRRRIAVVTGTRAEYGLLRSTMEAVECHRSLDLQLVVTGMHLLKRFGHTVDQIRRDGWRIDARIRMQAGDDSSLDQAVGLARGVRGIARFLGEAETDVVLVLGDRIEAMAGALAAVTTGRFVAHVHGGDIAPGDYDESIRHAITKLSHLHLAATRAARRRIIRMGEAPQRVHWVGAPGLDRLVGLLKKGTGSELIPGHTTKKRSLRGACPLLQHPPSGRRRRSGRALVLQHACGRTAEREGRVMSALLRAVARAGLARTIIYPGSDRGHAGIVAAIEAHQNHFDATQVEVVRSLERDVYLQRLIDAEVLVGNSSSGIIEAGSAGTPVVNVGSRQQGRQRSGLSVVDCGESLTSIRQALRTALRKRPIIGARTVYGDGRAGGRIAEQLVDMPLSDGDRRKVADLSLA